MASATFNATRQTGSALGIAVLDVILSDRAVSALGAYLEQAMVQANLSKTLAEELVNNQGASVAAGTRLNPAMLAGLLQRSLCRGAHRRHRYHRCCYFNLVYGLAAQFHSEKDDVDRATCHHCLKIGFSQPGHSHHVGYVFVESVVASLQF